MTKTLATHKAAAKQFMAHIYPDRQWWVIGGLLRDYELGVKPKDIDIFVNGKEGDLMPSDCSDIGDHNAYLLRATTIPDYEYAAELYEINVIFMRGPEWSLASMTERCDFGLCQIGWDPITGETYKTSAYMRDVNMKTFTLQRETPSARVNRMTDKFPYFTFENPQNLALDGKRSWRYDAETMTLVTVFGE